MEAIHILYHMLSDIDKDLLKHIAVTNKNDYKASTGTLTVTPFVVVKGNTSLAKAMVAHEVGHIQQNFWWYSIFNLATIALWAFCFVVGFFYSLSFVFSAVALLTNWLSLIIVEMNASYRAYQWLKKQKCANMKIVKKFYFDSLITYIQNSN